jgi:putative transposase
LSAKTTGSAGETRRALAVKSEKGTSFCYNNCGFAANSQQKEVAYMATKSNNQEDSYSLAHTKWNCKYHIVFAPKFRRKEIYGQKRAEIGKILRDICSWKGVEIVKANACPDHIHMLLSIPPKMSVSGFVGFLKGKSSVLIFEKFGNLKYKYGNKHFWCRGYYVDTVGRTKKRLNNISKISSKRI